MKKEGEERVLSRESEDVGSGSGSAAGELRDLGLLAPCLSHSLRAQTWYLTLPRDCSGSWLQGRLRRHKGRVERKRREETLPGHTPSDPLLTAY